MVPSRSENCGQRMRNSSARDTYVQLVQLGLNAFRSNPDALATPDGTRKQYLLDRVYDTAVMGMEMCRELGNIKLEGLSVSLVQYIVTANTKGSRQAAAGKALEHAPTSTLILRQRKSYFRIIVGISIPSKSDGCVRAKYPLR